MNEDADYNKPLFHVRFIQGGVEQEQIFTGTDDGDGNVSVNLPTPCTLLSVKQHGFPFCPVCDNITTEVFIGGKRVSDEHLELIRQDSIRAEVEAMEWPEIIDA